MRGEALFTLTCLAIFAAQIAIAQQEESKKSTGSVKCYVCNSLNKGQENCSSSDETALAPYLKTCPKITEGQLAGRSATMCRKVLQEIYKQEGVIRECSYTGEEELDGKRRIGNKGIILYLYQCENEGDKPCNSATAFGTLNVFLLALIAAIFSIY